MWLYLLPLFILLSLLVWKKSYIIISKKGRYILPLLHVLILLFISLSLAQVKAVFRKEKTVNYKTVFVVDVSHSIDENTIKNLVPSLSSLVESFNKPHISCEVLLFNSKVLPVPTSYGVIEDSLNDSIIKILPDGNGSNLTKALSDALGTIPATSGGSVVLLTDGVNTGPDISSVIAKAGSRKIPFFVLPLSSINGDSLKIEQLRLPSEVFINERYAIETHIYSASSGKVGLSLYKDDSKIAFETIDIIRGITKWSYQANEDSAGHHRYKVKISPLGALADQFKENNSQIGSVLAKTIPQVLLVTSDQRRISSFMRSMNSAGLKVKTILPSAFPFSVSTLLQYSAIIFENVPARDLTLRQLKYVKTYVKDYGGGFMMTGGENSFGTGGYSDSDIEDISPVLMSPQTYSSSFGLILLLDSSGSMRGFPIDWVKRAAKQIVWLMRGKHLGIYHFNQNAHIAVPLQKVEKSRLQVDQEIDSIQATGATAFAEALTLASKHLDERGFSSKHIILLSDGNPSDVMLLDQLYPLINKADIKVSTIGIGRQVNNVVLREIANQCGGVFYHSAEFDRIPKIFEEEIIRVIGPPYIEEKFEPQLTVANGVLEEFSPGSFPLLGGYVGTSLKSGAIGELYSHKGDVIFAHWQKGLGKTAVFTSTAGYGKWSELWPRWKDISAFWGTTVKSILRTRTSDYEIKTRTSGSQSEIFIDAVDSDGKYINGARLTMWIVSPGSSRAVSYPVKQIGLGRYYLSYTMEQQGFYTLSLSREIATGRKEEVATTVLAMAFAPEYAFSRPSKTFLRRLAISTGGSILDSLNEFDAEKQFANLLVKDISYYDMWPWFLLLAFLLYILEISLRRLNVFARDDSDGASGETVQYKRIADNFMKMAQELDRKGKEEQAQKFYLKARSFYLKAEHTDKAARMWERYRHLDSERG